MLTTYEVDLVRKLALEQHSHRSISRLAGVSRESVRSILSGRRPDYDAILRGKEQAKIVPSGAAMRCPTCGALVYMPCLACRIRAWKASRQDEQHDA